MELKLSLMGTAPGGETIRKLLKNFEETHSARVSVSYQAWDTAWAELVRNSIHGYSPAVSEVGTSWVPDLVGMNALHPLPASLKKELGSREAYVPQSWDSCFLVGNPQLWAVPWISGTRIIYYRRDLLARAGLDPREAFSSFQSMLESVARLAAAGVDCPWVTSTVASVNTLHLILSWVWGAGGEIISNNGRRLLFTEDAALDGMARFFRMARSMGPASKGIGYEDAVERFWGGGAAVTVDGSWQYAAQRSNANPLVLQNIGFAPLPGPAFVGGSNLVIWTNTHDKEAALKLLLYMSEPEAVRVICHLTGLAPARLDQLAATETTRLDFHHAISRAFESGRSLPNIVFSAMLEDKLHHAFGEIWADVLNSPQDDPREILTRRLVPLKERMELMLNS